MKHLLIVALLLNLFFASALRAQAPTAGQQVDRCVLGWIPYWDQKRATDSFARNARQFGTISVFWYFLDPSGQIRKYTKAKEDKTLIDFAHANGVKVLGLIANLPDDQENTISSFVTRLLGQQDQGSNDEVWDTATPRKMMRSPELRAAHIADLVALAKRMNFDGINIDYESLGRKDREDFTTFIRELSDALHAEDLILAVALHPKTREFSPEWSNGSHAQDWDALHPLADQLHLITYGEHEVNSAPGPVASPDWMDRILKYAVDVRRVPTNKLFIGIPLYAESWSKTESGAYQGTNLDLTYEDVRLVMRETGAKPRWDDASASPYLIYDDQTGTQNVWYENYRSVAEKLKFREKYSVCNIGLWRLGGEDPNVWSEIKKAMRVSTEEKVTPPTD